jgi:polysaccharide export outer membrane protein
MDRLKEALKPMWKRSGRKNRSEQAGNAVASKSHSKRVVLVCCMMLHICAMQMHAQFNGPAGGTSTSENKPVVMTNDQAVLRPATHDFVLGQGDQVALQVFGAPDFTQTLRVLPDGTLTLPLIGTIAVSGLTVAEAEQLIANKLRDDGMVRNPQVTVTVTDAPNQVATVVGEVRTPGLIPVIGQRSLLDVLTAAGGIAITGSHVITILRPGVPDAITVDLGSDPARSREGDIPIFAGDHIIVPRTGVVYAFGAFHTQGAYPLSNSVPLTLMQVCALAGGIPFEAQRNGARIIRTVGTERKEIKVNLDRVIFGKDPDPILQPDDIVFVPTDELKAAIHAGGISTILAAVYGLQYIQ